jgi:hypothetical protein
MRAITRPRPKFSCHCENPMAAPRFGGEPQPPARATDLMILETMSCLPGCVLAPSRPPSCHQINPKRPMRVSRRQRVARRNRAGSATGTSTHDKAQRNKGEEGDQGALVPGRSALSDKNRCGICKPNCTSTPRCRRSAGGQDRLSKNREGQSLGQATSWSPVNGAFAILEPVQPQVQPRMGIQV